MPHPSIPRVEKMPHKFDTGDTPSIQTQNTAVTNIMSKELQRAVADAQAVEANDQEPGPNENSQAIHTIQELQTTVTS